ncbi:hypothetical protein K501DRAFT_270140 [Backusella circina FSU 941]|nr:hypothetical protein K501DRAFT_270140 [Backusella circina FSU 941]
MNEKENNVMNNSSQLNSLTKSRTWLWVNYIQVENIAQTYFSLGDRVYKGNPKYQLLTFSMFMLLFFFKVFKYFYTHINVVGFRLKRGAALLELQAQMSYKDIFA